MGRTIVNLTELTDGQNGIVIRVEGSGKNGSDQRRAKLRRNPVGTENGFGSRNEDCMEPLNAQNCPEERCGFVQRLMDLGLTPGAKVALVKSAPFNGPMEILVRGSRIALGRCVASRIKVEVTE
jgi:Fe2+ transport system protein FeoA